ncbi:hypothetical protein ABLN73_20055, partial [Mycobacterium tuberculosis]
SVLRSVYQFGVYAPVESPTTSCFRIYREATPAFFVAPLHPDAYDEYPVLPPIGLQAPQVPIPPPPPGPDVIPGPVPPTPAPVGAPLPAEAGGGQ